jgi:hypothetical protein
MIMKTGMKLFIGALVLLLAVGLIGIGNAWAKGPGDDPGTPVTVDWDGNGTDDGLCSSFESDPDLNPAPGMQGWLFILTSPFDGSGSVLTYAFEGGPSGSVSGTFKGGGVGSYHYIVYTAIDARLLSASATNGTDKSNLTVSHCRQTPAFEELTVSKTVVTSYTRTHHWSINKDVDPDELYLYVPGQGESYPSSGTATWTVDVTYEGSEDSDWNVSGTITIRNTGNLSAVITSIEDLLAGSSIPVDCGVSLPYTFGVGGTLNCTYDEDGYVEGVNVVTVTTQEDSYSSPEVAIVWGDPTTEIDKTVTITDESDLFGEVELGEVTAPDDAQFTYTKDFDWEDYGDEDCGDHTYDNIAKVIGDNDALLDEAGASIEVHVQCHVPETAYGLGTNPTCFIPQFSNWGWTNHIATKPTVETWELWAGAGQCDTSKGTLVGSVTVTYGADGYVDAAYNVSLPFTIIETHVYAGTDQYPRLKDGGDYTVAPGQYTNEGPFSGPIWVIAHAVVGLPDPSFGLLDPASFYTPIE